MYIATKECALLISIIEYIKILSDKNVIFPYNNTNEKCTKKELYVYIKNYSLVIWDKSSISSRNEFQDFKT